MSLTQCLSTVDGTGDIYIVLQTLASSKGTHSHKIHLWRGSKVMQVSILLLRL